MYLKGGAICHFLKVSLCKHGKGQVESVSVEGERIIILMCDVTKSWYGQIGAEKVEANGKLTT